MNKKISILVAFIIIVVLGAVMVYTIKKADNVNKELNQRQQAIEEARTRPTITINTKYQFKDGTHTFVGIVEVPTPCYTDNIEVIKTETETILAISYADGSSEDSVCANVIEERPFRVSFKGVRDENILATLNGELVNLNIFEVGLDKDIDDIDLFIKG